MSAPRRRRTAAAAAAVLGRHEREGHPARDGGRLGRAAVPDRRAAAAAVLARVGG